MLLLCLLTHFAQILYNFYDDSNFLVGFGYYVEFDHD